MHSDAKISEASARPALPGQARTSKAAVCSLVLGVLGFLTLGLSGIPAVICGHLAIGKIRRSGGAISGKGLALAGLITGYLSMMMILLASLATPMILREIKAQELTRAESNARDIFMLLIGFDQDFGTFPSAKTAPKVMALNPTLDLTGTSSNALFRQLLASGMTGSEEPFFAGSAGNRRPDKNFVGVNALAPGESGFAYVTGCSSTSPAHRPVLMSPFVPGTQRFDPDPYGRMAMVIFMDGSIQNPPIDADGHALLAGKDILNPAHPCWAGDPPVLAMPE